MLSGFVDLVSREHALGWAIDRSQPNHTAEVTILVSGEERAKLRAVSTRKDLAKTGKFGEGRHGFSYRFDPVLTPSEAASVQVVFSSNGRLLPGSDQNNRFKMMEANGASCKKEYRKILAFGAYGTNNVGDEAIFQGIKKIHPDCTQIYINKSHLSDAVWYWDVMQERAFFSKEDLLIIGGGGLLYNKSAVTDMLNLARHAQDAGARVEILGIGCESAQDSYKKEICDLLGTAEKVTVRSSISQEILKNFCGEIYETQEDFAFNLRPDARISGGSGGDALTIGIVTSGDVREDRSELCAAIRKQALAGLRNASRVRFVHIPHSKSQVGPHNNDCVVGQHMWSSVGLLYDRGEELFRTRDFTPDPFDVLEYYGTIDAVVTMRFHGMIFGELAGIPTLALRGSSLKNRSLIEDRMRPGLMVSREAADFVAVFDSFIDFVCSDKERRRQYMESYRTLSQATEYPA